MRFQPEKCLYRFENGIKSCYSPYSFRNHLLGWSVLLTKVKNQGVFGGYLLNFPLKNGPPLKIEILQYLDLGLLLEAEILLKYVSLAPFFSFCIFYRPEEIFYRPELQNFRICISNSTRLFLR